MISPRASPCPPWFSFSFCAAWEIKMNEDSGRGLVHIMRAFGWSIAGLRYALRHEEAFRIELALFAVLAPLALMLGQSGLERAVLAGSLMLVLIVELVNTAVESTVDRIGNERHPLSECAKDVASAAVLLALLNVPLVWALVLFG
jgi:diacylglycerol kinase (ATP)